MQDTGHILFDNYGCGEETRNKLDEQIKSGERSFREVSEEMWGSLDVPFDDGFVVMEKTLEIDPGFREFHQYCIENGFPFNVISAGLKPVLRRVLDTFLGEKEVRLDKPEPQIFSFPKKRTMYVTYILTIHIRQLQSTSSPTTP
jgi:2-hydroxy-3-keto-5-methylthiopentenyl-1-phosphate phosphatase